MFTFLACKQEIKKVNINNKNHKIEIVTPKGSERPEIFIGNENFKNAKANDLTIEGVNFIKNGEYLNAERKFIEALKLEHDNPTILNNLGNLSKDFGDTLKAIDYYNKSIIFSDSTYFNSLYNLGLTYCNMDRYKESEKILTYILENYKNENYLSATNYVLANVFIGLKDCSKAQEAVAQAELLYTNEPKMLENLNRLKKKVKECTTD